MTIDATPKMLLDADYIAIKDTAIECEELGYDSLWVMDHFNWGEGNEGAVFEAWTLLSALSREVEELRLGTMVACNSYRNPTLTAKMAATLDVISAGRLILGYGAGWKRDEYRAYGFPFPSPRTRVRQMREAVKIMKKMWTEGRTSFNGDFYRVEDAVCNPKPMQKPHPPIIIGGGGEKLTLRVAAELGDGWNIWDAPVEDYEHKKGVLKGYCKESGRSIEDLELSWSGNLVLAEDEAGLRRRTERLMVNRGIFCTYDDCIEVLQRYVDLGCSHFIFSLNSFDEEKRDFIEKVAPSF